MQMTYRHFYSLTPRSFSNAVQGYRNKEETLSRERFLIMRKLMYASLRPHGQSSFQETDIMVFPWEELTIKKLSEEQAAQALLEVEKVNDFWRNYDEKKIGKA